MENLRKNFLLGVNPETNEIFLGEIEITTRNGYKEFTASFDVGEAFDIDTIDLDQECEFRWDCFDAATKLDLLYDGDITKKEVFKDWMDDMDYRNFIDCSCTDYETKLNNGQTINFETTCGGQYDIREYQENYNSIIFTNKKAVELILELWDKYHLKNIENNLQEIEKKVNEILKNLNSYNSREFENIENFIIKNIKEI